MSHARFPQEVERLVNQRVASTKRGAGRDSHAGGEKMVAPLTGKSVSYDAAIRLTGMGHIGRAQTAVSRWRPGQMTMRLA